MTINPARIVGINKGTLAVGADADITIIDPKVRWTVKEEEMRSKCSNSPFIGWELTGRADVVIVGGKVKLDRHGAIRSCG
jgi:dihydroorotase